MNFSCIADQFSSNGSYIVFPFVLGTYLKNGMMTSFEWKFVYCTNMYISLKANLTFFWFSHRWFAQRVNLFCFFWGWSDKLAIASLFTKSFFFLIVRFCLFLTYYFCTADFKVINSHVFKIDFYMILRLHFFC